MCSCGDPSCKCYKSGYNDGFKFGSELGSIEGYGKGYNDGFWVGLNTGFKYGANIGFSKGYEKGYFDSEKQLGYNFEDEREKFLKNLPLLHPSNYLYKKVQPPSYMERLKFGLSEKYNGIY